MSGQRKVGGQRKRFEDSPKSSLKTFGISPDNCESVSSDRKHGIATSQMGKNYHENNLLVTAKSKRAARKSRPTKMDKSPHITCPQYNRTFTSNISLWNHLRLNQEGRTTLASSFTSRKGYSVHVKDRRILLLSLCHVLSYINSVLIGVNFFFKPILLKKYYTFKFICFAHM
jgi:hypothetical protein